MDMHHLNEWINNPELLCKESVQQLRSLLLRYPYFQTAWVLYLKNLYMLNDPSFKDELRRGALFVADLSLLFYYIEGERFVIKKHENISGDISGENVEGGSSDRTLDLIDRFLSGLSESPAQLSSSSLSSVTSPLSPSHHSSHTAVMPQPHSSVSSGVASKDNNGDSYNKSVPEIPIEVQTDYTSYLLSSASDNTDDSDESVPVMPMNGQDLIDSFIEKAEEGKVTNDYWDRKNTDKTAEGNELDDSDINGSQPDDALSGGVLSLSAEDADQEEDSCKDDICKLSSSSDNEDFDVSAEHKEDGEEEYLTETLAKIYVKQQRYDKALEIIKKLNLKYPKKNAYFADQMRFLEKLIINAKSK